MEDNVRIKDPRAAAAAIKKDQNEHVYANTNPDGTITKTVTDVNPEARRVTKVEIISERTPVGSEGIHRAMSPENEQSSSHSGNSGTAGVYSGNQGLIFYGGSRETHNQLPVGTSKFALLVPMDQVPQMQARARKTSLTTENDFIQDAIAAHNHYRFHHGAPPLTLDIELCKVAQAWANKLSISGTKTHSPNGYGECLYWRPHGPVSGRDAVTAWYEEGKHFRWNIMDLQNGTNNFTQLVWKNSAKVGIAIAAGGYGIYIVANYNPPGNIRGQFKENVLPIQQHHA